MNELVKQVFGCGAIKLGYKLCNERMVIFAITKEDISIDSFGKICDLLESLADDDSTIVVATNSQENLDF